MQDKKRYLNDATELNKTIALKDAQRVSFKNNQTQNLQQLVLKFQQYPPNTKQRQIVFTQLAKKIQKSRQIFHPYNSKYPREIYEDALQNTWLELYRKIEDYDPNKCLLIGWFNFILKRRYLDEIRRYYKKGMEVSLDNCVTSASNTNGQSQITYRDLIAQPETRSELFDKLQQVVEEDPEGIFQNHHIKKKPHANFQALFLRRLAGESFKEIGADWGNIPVPTLSAFFYRACERFAPKLQKYLQV